MNSYVLITTAKDEAEYLEPLIQSVLAQTVPPLRWVIVNDGSTDNTGEIIERYAALHPWILFNHVEGAAGRSFASKARGFGWAYDQIKGLGFDFVGTLDADVTFEPDYYEQIIARMQSNPRLGVAGGALWDKDDEFFKRLISSPTFPPGPILFFRRLCFEEVGGYRTVSVGGVDSISVQTSRMLGWDTREFDELKVYHHKPTGASAGSWLRRCYRDGLTEYYIGTHPLFAIAKAIRRAMHKPLFLGSLVRLIAYFRLWVVCAKRDAAPELVRYLALEQMTRLKTFLWKGTL